MIFQPLRRRGTARSRIRTYWPSVAAAAEGTRTASTAGRRRGARTSSAPCRAGASASTSTYTPSRCATPPPSSARLTASSCRPPHPPALHPTQARAHEPSPRRARAHGRAGAPSRWEIDAAAADPPLRVLTIKLHQQYEAPAAVVATVCGTPLEARLRRHGYATLGRVRQLCDARAPLSEGSSSPERSPASLINLRPYPSPERSPASLS